MLVLALLTAGDAGSQVRELCRFDPGVDPVFVRHLLYDDDRTFRSYCEATGQSAIRDVHAKLDWMLWSAPPDSYPTRYAALAPHLERLVDELAVVYGCAENLRLLEFRRALGPRVTELNRAVVEFHRVQREVAMPLAEKLARYRGIQDEFERLDYEHGLTALEGQLARAIQLSGDSIGHAVLLRSALARARRTENHMMMCQYLGELGFAFERAGLVDSMYSCYLEGVAIADRHRIPDQAVRLRRFLASHYVDQGRFAMAMRLAREAQSACRRWGGEVYEVSMVLWTMERFADLGCWDIVQGLSQRLRVLLRVLEQTRFQHEYLIYSLRAQRLDARLMAADGNPDEAAAIMSELREPALRLHGPDSNAPLQVERATALLSAGRPREAQVTARDGVAYADSFRQWRPASRLAVIRVRAALALGDLDLARSAMRDLDARVKRQRPGDGLEEWECDELEARIALASGHTEDAKRMLMRGLRNLRANVGAMDAGPYSYLALAGAESLRAVAHHLLADDPASSYRFELEWRSLAGQLGRGGDALAPSTDPRAPDVPASRARSIHLVYGFTDGVLTRWTRSAGSVRREVLHASLRQCDERVEKAMRMLGHDPGEANARMPDELREVCSDLGRLLLPREVRDGPPATLVISAEGPIARLPFEALDLGSGPAYEPVLARHDVVYARPVPPIRRRTGAGNSVILVESEEWPGDRAALAAAGGEANRARARLPKPRLMNSSQVSKRDLLQAWSRASVLYVAAHLERNPEAPLLCYFPMTFAARPNRPEDSYLDLLDARTTDLSGCELAVLSSCASGEPYVVGGRSGPSMADALLDAGAKAVIHTRWQVRDERAAEVAPELAHAWLEARTDPVASWCARRRAGLRGATGWRHPFDWAAWSATVTLTTQPGNGERTDVIAVALRSGRVGSGRQGGSPEPSGSPR